MPPGPRLAAPPPGAIHTAAGSGQRARARGAGGRYSLWSMDPAAAHLLVAPACAALGLIIGSFLNVVVHRLPRGMSLVTPASHCPRCGADVAWFDNVPVAGWLALRGRCRSCRQPISVRYPLVELATGAGFAAVAATAEPLPSLAPLLLVVAAALAGALVDLDGHPVPLPVAAAAALGAAGTVPVAALAGQPGRLSWAALGAAGLGGATLASRGRHHSGPPIVGRALTGGALGWCAGWLWAPAAFVCTGWLALATATAVLGPVPEPGDAGPAAVASPTTAARQTVRAEVLAAEAVRWSLMAGLVVVVVGSVLGRP